ncbi:hypothetical protein [Qipengyuania marisflavi]|uniref:Lipoprotein n=1 Tax=Qipengyuania marisflavi TaxID=2486356 RepID=A0A5S3P2Y9_9SPHN|nr:hypothetical protein [Qipengyuania marisflavi]TMM47140.1 hypothetical protein FEV51_10135 [Qipengyuania marisflavi]
MRTPLAVVYAALLVSCGQAEPEQSPSPDQALAALDGIYIARTAKPLIGPDGQPAPSRLALFHGSFDVVNSCLVSKMDGGEPALVRFSRDAEILVFPDRVRINTGEMRFGEQITRGGGFDGDNVYDLLVAPPPSQCRYSVIGP